MSEQTTAPRLTGPILEGTGLCRAQTPQPGTQGRRYPVRRAPAVGGGPGARRQRLRDAGHRGAAARLCRGRGRSARPSRRSGSTSVTTSRESSPSAATPTRHRNRRGAIVSRSTSLTWPRSARTPSWSHSPTSSTTRGRYCGTSAPTVHAVAAIHGEGSRRPPLVLRRAARRLPEPRRRKLDGRGTRSGSRRARRPCEAARFSRRSLTADGASPPSCRPHRSARRRARRAARHPAARSVRRGTRAGVRPRHGALAQPAALACARAAATARTVSARGWRSGTRSR